MSHRASAWAWDVDLKGDPLVKFVLVALADQADDYGYCWPSQKKIAEKVCQGERTVRRHIATLRDLGLLTVIRRSSTTALSPSTAPTAEETLRITASDRL